jgi:hypothetical protein
MTLTLIILTVSGGRPTFAPRVRGPKNGGTQPLSNAFQYSCNGLFLEYGPRPNASPQLVSPISRMVKRVRLLGHL